MAWVNLPPEFGSDLPPLERTPPKWTFVLRSMHFSMSLHHLHCYISSPNWQLRIASGWSRGGSLGRPWKPPYLQLPCCFLIPTWSCFVLILLQLSYSNLILFWNKRDEWCIEGALHSSHSQWLGRSKEVWGIGRPSVCHSLQLAQRSLFFQSHGVVESSAFCLWMAGEKYAFLSCLHAPIENRVLDKMGLFQQGS